MNINLINDIDEKNSTIWLVNSLADAEKLDIDTIPSDVYASHLSAKKPVVVNAPNKVTAVVQILTLDGNKNAENLRVIGHSIANQINYNQLDSVQIVSENAGHVVDISEGIILGLYKFNKYISDSKPNTLETINICCSNLSDTDLAELKVVCKGVYSTRDLVNEPQSYLTATQLSEEIAILSKDAGFSLEVFNKKKIESLKMGGLLAVNKGSIEPPTFNIMEHKPDNAVNAKPYVLVGKGVVYDTGGLSLKSTGKNMDFMKSDMAGSAAVIGTVYSVAKNNLPIWVIGLVPATDNRPSGDAYAPGDVITMFNGKTVEVLNTDAEGRLILADALTYAIKYDPELVIDMATLTGSAARTFGTQAIVSMGNASHEVHSELKKSGFAVHERLAELPFFDEYWDMLKSDIADLTNLGAPEGGAITAGKFLEYFTKNEKGDNAYPYLHLDIAGPAFLHSADKYRTIGGSGIGVRLLYHFLKSRC